MKFTIAILIASMIIFGYKTQQRLVVLTVHIDDLSMRVADTRRLIEVNNSRIYDLQARQSKPEIK